MQNVRITEIRVKRTENRGGNAEIARYVREVMWRDIQGCGCGVIHGVARHLVCKTGACGAAARSTAYFLRCLKPGGKVTKVIGRTTKIHANVLRPAAQIVRTAVTKSYLQFKREF